MIDFKTLCEKYEIDLGEKEEEFTKELLKNYKTIEEVERSKEKLAKAEEELTNYKADMESLQRQIESFSGTAEEINKLKSENEAYKQKEAEAAKLAEKEAFESLVNKQIKEAIGDKKFVNTYVENAFMNDLKAAIVSEENKDKTVSEVFREMSDNQSGLFASEQSYSEHPGISEGASDKENFNKDNKEVFAELLAPYFQQ